MANEALSILDSTKKILGLAPEYTAFDLDIITHINSVLASLNQLGVGPEGAFFITGSDETWTDFVGVDPKYNLVKSYLYLRVRLLFDPPATSFAIAAMEKQVQEMEWRLNIFADTPPDYLIDGLVIL